MNKTEAAYAAYLDTLKAAGEIRTWEYEYVRLLLAANTSYTPDFMVILANDLIEFHEVKGWWEDDARVKIKVAAERHKWAKFVAVTPRAKKDGGGWEREEFKP